VCRGLRLCGRPASQAVGANPAPHTQPTSCSNFERTTHSALPRGALTTAVPGRDLGGSFTEGHTLPERGRQHTYSGAKRYHSEGWPAESALCLSTVYLLRTRCASERRGKATVWSKCSAHAATTHPTKEGTERDALAACLAVCLFVTHSLCLLSALGPCCDFWWEETCKALEEETEESPRHQKPFPSRHPFDYFDGARLSFDRRNWADFVPYTPFYLATHQLPVEVRQSQSKKLPHSHNGRTSA